MAITLGGGGGGGGSPFPTMVFQESKTWACPVAMEALVFVIGGGGSGAFVGGTSTHQGGGGGAGGCAVSKLTLAAQNYTLTIGSGGTQVTGYWQAHGNAGGNTSMSGSGMTTMVGNGGSGGVYTYNATNSGSTGGTATGGTLYNNTGGGLPTNTPVGAYCCGGGGAVGLWETGEDGQWQNDNQKMGQGGKIQGSAGAYADDSEFNSSFDKIYKRNMPVVMEPFAGIHFQFAPLSTNSGSLDRTSVPSGDYPRKQLVSSDVYISPSGPFCGGAGYGGSNSGLQTAAAGIAGGGGGGIGKYSSGNFGSSGGGGTGIIIICPISMGA